MEKPNYVPARVKSFLSSLYVGHAHNFNVRSYRERVRRECKRERYEHTLPIDPCSFFEEILEAGNVSDEEREVIESVWLNDVLSINISESASELFTRLANSEKVKKKLEFLF